MKYAAAIKMPTGKVLFYTGMAGPDYLSSDITQAFFGYSQEGAMRKAVGFCEVRNSGLAAEHTPLVYSEPIRVHSGSAVHFKRPQETEGGSCD